MTGLERPHLQRGHIAFGQGITPGHGAGNTHEGLPLQGQVNHPQQRPVISDQRYIDGELASARQKFLGSVQRINHPEYRPMPALGLFLVGGLL